MRISLCRSIGIVVVIALAGPVVALDLQFKGNEAVSLCCLESGTAVLFFGYVWQERPWVARTTVVRAIETTPPNSKTAWYEPKVGAPPTSYWIGVDLSTGAFTWADRTGHGLDERKIPPENLTRNSERGIIGFDIEAGFLEVIVIRPGKGVWTLTAGDGSIFDGDGTINQNVRTLTEDLRPVGDGPEPPKTLIEGDVVLALDTWRGILSVTTIEK